MKKNEYVLGIDTSNYTTSVGIVTRDGEVVANIKRPLPVAPGARGLRQSDALFAHTKNLPSAMEEAAAVLRDGDISAVGVSMRPRNAEGSYMPCFLAGVAAAETAAAVSSAPLFRFSHQCGHLMAAISSGGRRDELLSRPFGAFHVSGGTTDLLYVRAVENGFLCERVGGARDLHAGLVIDRVGVALGLPFPCGPVLEALAAKNDKKVPRRKISADGCYVNLSGLENMALDLYHTTGDAPLVAAFVLDFLGNSLAAMATAYLSSYGASPLLFAGGVMCNAYLRTRLAGVCDAVFAAPSLSSDNAVGIAQLAARSRSNAAI